MSKVDELRALREARYASRGQVQTPVQKQAKATEALAKALEGPPPVTKECGKTGIGGKRCIRQEGHAEKNHRYAKS